MTLVEALALAWLERDEPELDAHEVVARLLTEVKDQRAELRREIRTARQLGLDRYRKKVLP